MMLERQSTTVPNTSKQSAFTEAGSMRVISGWHREPGNLVHVLLAAADAEEVAVEILHRELAHAPGLGLDRLDDLGAARAVLGIERVGVLHEDAHARAGLGLVLPGKEYPDVVVEDRAVPVAPRPGDVAAEDVAVV